MADIDSSELERLLDRVAKSSTKAAAKNDIQRLEFLASEVRSRVNGYAARKLAQAVNCAKEASGRVADKDHHIHRMQNALYGFRTEIANRG